MHQYSDKYVKWIDFIQQSRSKTTFAVPGGVLRQTANTAYSLGIDNSIETERLYGKDVDCPPDWRRWLRASGVIPSPVIPGSSNDLLRHVLKSVRSC